MKKLDWEPIDQLWRVFMIGVCFVMAFVIVLSPGFIKKQALKCYKGICNVKITANAGNNVNADVGDGVS